MSIKPSVVNKEQSAFAPLAHPVFRAIWIVELVSNIGTWMQDVGAGWLMTSLSTSPMLVALVQAATMFPMMLLALPAGALADIVDRRYLLLVAQAWMLLTATVLSVLTLLGLISASGLLVLTLCLGIGAAFSMPAWSAMLPDLVGKNELHAAVTLNGLAMNVSKAVGPALAGYIMAVTSPGMVFLFNALSFIGVLVVLFRWKNPTKTSELPAERMLGAIRNGYRYVRHSQPMLAIMIRAGTFFIFGSASWALLPILVRLEFHGGPGDYGMALASVGLGAIISVFILPSLRQRMSTDLLKKVCMTLYAATLALMALAPTLLWFYATTFVAGMAWLGVMSTLQGAAQTALPTWVRARGLSMVMVMFMGGMACGALIWGQIATHYSLAVALQVSAVGLAFSVLFTWRIKLIQMEGVDLTPSLHWPSPVVDQEPELDRGPALVTLTYLVDPRHLSEFLRLMSRLRVTRRRDGAFYWQLFQDAADSHCYVETFLFDSWVEHLRHHQRVTKADRLLQDEIVQCLIDESSPIVSHCLAVTDFGDKREVRLERQSLL